MMLSIGMMLYPPTPIDKGGLLRPEDPIEVLDLTL